MKMGLSAFENKTYRAIFGELCKRVRVEPYHVNFDEPNWYWAHTWTQWEQDDFKKWLIDYLMENKEAMKEISVYHYANKRTAERIADDLILNYGWKVENGI